MKILFLITLLSFIALSWAAFSILRHIRTFRSSRTLSPTPLKRDTRLTVPGSRG